MDFYALLAYRYSVGPKMEIYLYILERLKIYHRLNVERPFQENVNLESHFCSKPSIKTKFSEAFMFGQYEQKLYQMFSMAITSHYLHQNGLFYS